MKRLLRACTLAAAFITSGAASAAATDYAIGTDLVRWVDPVQDDGMANIVFQKAIGRDDALHMDFSMKDDRYLLGMDYKVYNQRYYLGTFMQVGAMLQVEDGNTDFGIQGAIGYEFSPFQDWILSSDIQLVYGPDHPEKDSQDPWIVPRVRLMYAF